MQTSGSGDAANKVSGASVGEALGGASGSALGAEGHAVREKGGDGAVAYVGSPELRGVQEIQREILVRFAEICERHGLSYFLDAGTLLGAVRHGGFIPWDDDVDVGMPRRDYDLFLRVAQEELGEAYFLQTRGSEANCPFSFAKIRRRNTTFLEWNKRNIDMHHGIWIDIFPYDSLPEEGREAYVARCIALDNKLLTRMIPDRVARPERSLRWFLGMLARRLKHYAYRGVSLAALDREIAATYRKYQYLEEEGRCKGYTCHSYGKPYYFPREVLFPTGKVRFEGREYSAPHDVDAFLRIFYDDYMRLPPEHERLGHRPYRVSLTEEYVKK